MDTRLSSEYVVCTSFQGSQLDLILRIRPGNVIIKAGAKIEIGSIEKQPLDQLAERVWLKDQDVVLEHPQTFGDVIIHEIETDVS